MTTSWTVLRRLDHAQKVAGDALFDGELALTSIDQVRDVLAAQQRQIIELSCTVRTLIKMLGEAGGVDAEVLRYRIEADVDETLDAMQPQNQQVTCMRCRMVVPGSRTMLTGSGPVCDTCTAIMSADEIAAL